MEKSGKTLELVRRLPAEPLMLVVHSAAMREYVRRMIGDVRGAEFLKGVRVEVIVRMHDTDRMLGYRDRVFIDHAVWDTLPGGVLSKIEILASGCNARHPKLPA